jgi:hypothetical protein
MSDRIDRAESNVDAHLAILEFGRVEDGNRLG